MTGQDWFEKDFYAMLGVPKNADAADIKKAYRKLARKLHPDANPGDASAEDRFKEVGEAYAVLSDPAEREKYDSVRAMAGGGARFQAGGPGGSGGFEDMFSGMFGQGGGGRMRYATPGGGGAGGVPPGFEDLMGMFGGTGFQARREPVRGGDMTAGTTLPFRTAIEGATVQLTVGGKGMSVRIPPGVQDGQKIKLRGKGQASMTGGPNGDLIITVSVTPHPVHSVDGLNLRMTVPVGFAEAALGTTLEVPTLDGSTVRLKVPAGTPSGRSLRVRGKGVKSAKGTGDLLVTVQVAVPARLSAEAEAAVEAYARATADADPRADWLEQARA